MLRIRFYLKTSSSANLRSIFQDHNINEKSYSRSRKKPGIPYRRGDKLHDVKMIRSTNTTCQWIHRSTFVQRQAKQTTSPIDIFARRKSTEREHHPIGAVSMSAAALAKKEDRFKSNLLSKIPINSTIVGSSNLLSSASQMNRSLTEDSKSKNKSSDMLMTGSFHETNSGIGANANEQTIANNSTIIVKHIYNRALDSFLLTDHCKGFLRANTGANDSTLLPPDFGVYCIRWRRTGHLEENESKFIIGGIGNCTFATNLVLTNF